MCALLVPRAANPRRLSDLSAVETVAMDIVVSLVVSFACPRRGRSSSSSPSSSFTTTAPHCCTQSNPSHSFFRYSPHRKWHIGPHHELHHQEPDYQRPRHGWCVRAAGGTEIFDYILADSSCRSCIDMEMTRTTRRSLGAGMHRSGGEWRSLERALRRALHPHLRASCAVRAEKACKPAV